MLIGSRVKEIIAKLKRLYPQAKCSLNFKTPVQLLVATILSAQCTDERVNLVTKDLFNKYKAAADFAQANLKQFEKEIKPVGFYHNKAKNIIKCCQVLVEKHQGRVPKTMEELIQLAGVGRKTANVVLGNAYGVPTGIAVDTHVLRLSQRLGWSKFNDPVKVEKDLCKLIPRKYWIMISHYLIWHGRAICKAQNPDHDNCQIAKYCPSRTK